jgi:small subunit ribosomal protein S15
MADKAKETVRKHENDTGSSSVQIADLSRDISRLTVHLQEHKKDFGCRRSLLKKVATRKKFLKYLKRTAVEAYVQVIETLGLKR